MHQDNLTAALGRADVAGTETGRRCKVGRIIDKASPAAQTILDIALGTTGERGDWTDNKLAAALSRGGHPIGATAIWRHRRQYCTCPAPDE